jgi:Na+-translocating ferredoxin:NAD+ oxidoreductase subunit C
MKALVNLSKLIQSAKEIFPFHGGVHPPENKLQSTQLPIGQLALPETLVLPLRQHVGNLPKISVQVGDHVLKGQLLADAEGTVSAAIHAPTSGVITAIADAIIPHPSGLPDLCISLQPDGKDEWIAHQATDWQQMDRSALVASLRHSGIVGLGGATFPTQIKLRHDGKSNVHTLVINAAECEPYITCDDMLMRERADEIVQGIAIAQYLLGAEKVLIGIEDNKPEAITAMQAATAGKGMQVVVVPTLYPSGDARRLVYLLLGEEIPHNKRSTEVGLQVFNVATVLSLHRFFNHGEPAISRIVSMTGHVQQPRNFEVLFGTPLSHLVAAAGGAKAGTSHYIMGGPMMGFDLPDANVPITKAANCIIAAAPDLFAPPPPAMPCIRCARCADACPVSLQPQELYWFAKADNFEKARDYHLFDCIECGACSYVCPSDIPLVQYYRYAKSEIIAADKAKEAANLARERNEARLARIEREKLERAQKHAERAQGSKQAPTQDAPREKNDALETNQNKASSDAPLKADANDAKKAAIAAAIERAKAAKAAAAASGEAPKNMEPVNAAIQHEIAEIDARRAAVGLETPAVDAEKQAKIAAAIARAKAAKAAAANGEAPKNSEPVNAAIQHEIAEIDARPTAGGLETPAVDAEKQAKIAAAIARAKAAKAAKVTTSAENMPHQVEVQASEPTANLTPNLTKDAATDKPLVARQAAKKSPSPKKAVVKKPSKKMAAKSASVKTVGDSKPFRIMEAMARAKAEKNATEHPDSPAKSAEPTTVAKQDQKKDQRKDKS